MNRSGRFSLAVVLLLGAAAGAGCGASSSTLGREGGVARDANGAPGRETARPAVVRVAEPSAVAATGETLIPAALSVEGMATVLAQRDGTVKKLDGQEGSRVAAGQILLQLGGDEDLRAQLRQAELEVNRSKVEEREYEALIKLNRSELEREKMLFKDGLSSERDVERAQFKLEGALLELEKTRVASQAAQSKIDSVKIEIEKTTVRAPMAGVVTHRYARLGASVVKNDKLFEITQLTPVEVKFQLPQSDRGRLAPGSMVDLSPAEGNGIIARARVKRIEPTADPASNTLGYVADVIGGRGLMPGLAVNVHVPSSAAGTSFWITRRAFPPETDLRAGASSTLFVAEGTRCASRTVVVNTVSGDQVEILSGLTAGDRVILSPPAGLKAGDAIEVQ